jgi:hypothetical protein
MNMRPASLGLISALASSGKLERYAPHQHAEQREDHAECNDDIDIDKETGASTWPLTSSAEQTCDRFTTANSDNRRLSVDSQCHSLISFGPWQIPTLLILAR